MTVMGVRRPLSGQTVIFSGGYTFCNTRTRSHVRDYIFRPSSFRSHKQSCSPTLPELRYKEFYNPNTDLFLNWNQRIA